LTPNQLVVASGSFGLQPGRSALLHITSGVSLSSLGMGTPDCRTFA